MIMKGKRLNGVSVATFIHANGVEPPSAFLAVIDWGDGSTSQGLVTQSGTTYTVAGTHDYQKGGRHTITTTVTEVGEPPLAAPSQVIAGQPTSRAPFGAISLGDPSSIFIDRTASIHSQVTGTAPDVLPSIKGSRARLAALDTVLASYN